MSEYRRSSRCKNLQASPQVTFANPFVRALARVACSDKDVTPSRFLGFSKSWIKINESPHPCPTSRTSKSVWFCETPLSTFLARAVERCTHADVSNARDQRPPRCARTFRCIRKLGLWLQAMCKTILDQRIAISLNSAFGELLTDSQNPMFNHSVVGRLTLRKT